MTLHDDRTLSVILVEDEPVTRDLLVSWIIEHPSLRLRSVAKDGAEALAKMQSENFDLVFLDIDLPLMSGLEILDRLETIPYIVFITASSNHAIRAFELGAVDYLQKPFDRSRLDRAIEKALQKKKLTLSNPGLQIERPGLIISENENYYLIPFRDIIYISSHDGRTIVHTEEREYESSRSISEMEQKVPSSILLRIHKQYILNLSYISHIQYLIGGRYHVFLKDEEESSLTVGRKYVENFKKRLDLS